MLQKVIFIALIFLMATPSFAEEVVNVRAGVHPSYSRLVFDWKNAPEYTVSLSQNTLNIVFQKSASLDLSSLNNRDLPNIESVKVSSENPEATSVSIEIGNGVTFRHFATSDRIVLDINSPNGQTMTAKKEKSEPVKVVQDNPPKVEEAEETRDVEKAQAVPAAPVEQKPLLENTMDPHVITLTATRVLGLSVFERSGFLWIVADDPELSIPPQVSGPNPEIIPEFTKFDIPGGVAFRTTLPENSYVYGEGGGLLWRVVVTPNERDLNPVAIETQTPASGVLRGGTLSWGLINPRKVLELRDPVVGDLIKIVTVEDSGQFAGPPKSFVELETLPSFVGLAVRPKIDDLEITTSPRNTYVTKPKGLVLVPEKDKVVIQAKKATQTDEDLEETESNEKQIFNFNRWQMGGLQELQDNQTILLSNAGSAKNAERIEKIITLAKLNLANNRSFEALGFLRVAEQLLPDIVKSPEFMALRAAANSLAGKDDSAIVDLNKPALQEFPEIQYWKSKALAMLQDWQQAQEVLPDNFDTLASYPTALRDPIALVLTEVALRAGKIPVAEGLLGMMQGDLETMIFPYQAAWNYLMGEAQRQLENIDGAKEYWGQLTNGKDDLYRAKAGLALTRLELENGDITPEVAIDRLEGLRYAWRGDELETLINYRLGEAYIKEKDYIKGLSVLRNAASLASGTDLGTVITSYMTDTFRDIFMSDKLDDINPLDAVRIHDEFEELTPTGREGDLLIQELAERLFDADLLGRASALLEHQLTHRVEGEDKARVALRLAAVRLLDKKPDGALRSLDIAEQTFKEISPGGEVPADKAREILLMRAKALAEQKQTDRALSLLEDIDEDDDVTRLRVDIAWNAGRWDDAAEALQDLIFDQDISLRRPLTKYQADLLLNRAIALNLSGNRVALANVREAFGESMKQTDNARAFEVVTRPRQVGLLASRDAVSSMISEVDLFKEFLDSYKSMAPTSN